LEDDDVMGRRCPVLGGKWRIELFQGRSWCAHFSRAKARPRLHPNATTRFLALEKQSGLPYRAMITAPFIRNYKTQIDRSSYNAPRKTYNYEPKEAGRRLLLLLLLLPLPMNETNRLWE
jgi:hypothetical protein